MRKISSCPCFNSIKIHSYPLQIDIHHPFSILNFYYKQKQKALQHKLSINSQKNCLQFFPTLDQETKTTK